MKKLSTLILFAMLLAKAYGQLLPGQIDPRFNPDDDGLEAAGGGFTTHYSNAHGILPSRFEGFMHDGKALAFVGVDMPELTNVLLGGSTLYIIDSVGHAWPALIKYPYSVQYPWRYGRIRGGKPGTDGSIFIHVDSTVKRLAPNGLFDDSYSFTGNRVARVVHVDAQNRLLVQEHQGTTFVIHRYLPNGARDNAFTLSLPYNALMCATSDNGYFWTTVEGNDYSANYKDSTEAIKTNADGLAIGAQFKIKVLGEGALIGQDNDGFNVTGAIPTNDGGMVASCLERFDLHDYYSYSSIRVHRFTSTGSLDLNFTPLLDTLGSDYAPIVAAGPDKFLFFQGYHSGYYSMQSGARIAYTGYFDRFQLNGTCFICIFSNGRILFNTFQMMKKDFAPIAPPVNYISGVSLSGQFSANKVLLSSGDIYIRKSVDHFILVDALTGKPDTTFHYGQDTAQNGLYNVVVAGDGIIRADIEATRPWVTYTGTRFSRRLGTGEVDSNFTSFTLPCHNFRCSSTPVGRPDGGFFTTFQDTLLQYSRTGQLVPGSKFSLDSACTFGNITSDGSLVSMQIVGNLVKVYLHNASTHHLYYQTSCNNNPSISRSFVYLSSDGTLIMRGINFSNLNGVNYPTPTLVVKPDTSVDVNASIRFSHIVSLTRNNNYDYLESLFMPDGKGHVYYAQANLTAGSMLVRYTMDGRLDNTFIPAFCFPSAPRHLLFTSDGGVLLDGSYLVAGRQGSGLTRIYGGTGDAQNLNSISGSVNVRGSVATACALDSTDRPAVGAVITDPVSGYYALSDSSGQYHLDARAGVGNALLAGRFGQEQPVVCPVAQQYHVPFAAQNGVDSAGRKFLIHAPLCGDLHVEAFSAPRARPCERHYASVSYGNTGYVPVDSARLVLTLPDSSIFLRLQTLDGHAVAYSRTGNTLFVPLGTLAPASSGRIIIIDSMPCRLNMVGGYLRLVAEIFPTAERCNGRQADNAQLHLTTICGANPAFEVRNLGQAMSVPATLKVFRADTLINSVTLQLAAGASQSVSYFQDSSAVYAEVLYGPTSTNQHVVASASCLESQAYGPLYPSVGASTVWAHIGYSYDPNEKTVSPSGFDAEGSVRPGTELIYTLHFENTGSDTAFYVRIADTLDAALDPATLHVLGSTHPVQTRLSGKAPHVVADFVFSPISLPATRDNATASSGAVRFSVKPKAGTALGTSISNQARIYFDNNLPIVTNATRSRIAWPAGVTATAQPIAEANTIKVWPNPNTGTFTVALPHAPALGEQLVLRNTTGTTVRTLACKTSQVQITGLAPGVYALQTTSGAYPPLRVIVVK